jgi:hypothetical protein
MRGVDFQVNGLPIDAFVVSRYPRRFVLDFPFDVLKIGKSTVGYVMKLCPFWLRSHTRCGMWYMDLIIFWRIVLARDVDKL